MFNMGFKKQDRSLDALLELNGVTFFIDDEGQFMVRFRVTQVDQTPEKPHGLDYSLTLHDNKGQRLIGFDNAHSVRPTRGPGGKGRKRHDHKHKGKAVRPYIYKDAATLLKDFWAEVDTLIEKQRK